jgi:hypothetical protein
MKLQTLAKAIRTLNSTAEFNIDFKNENDFKIIWHNNTKPIDIDLILAKQAELQALEDVYDNRRKEYGNWQSQLDEIYHDGLDAWKDRISAIKLKYPKE